MPDRSIVLHGCASGADRMSGRAPETGFCTATHLGTERNPAAVGSEQPGGALSSGCGALAIDRDRDVCSDTAADSAVAPESDATETAGLRLSSRFRLPRRLSPLGGAAIVLAAHAVHLLALPLLAVLLGMQDAASGGASLSGHAHHASASAGSEGLLLRWSTDLLAAATVIAAIAMCRAAARSWQQVRQHPLLCAVHTAIAALCIMLIAY